MNHKIREAAESILKLELCIQKANSTKEITNALFEMEKIANDLTPEEMVEVDDYIQEKMKCYTES